MIFTDFGVFLVIDIRTLYHKSPSICGAVSQNGGFRVLLVTLGRQSPHNPLLPLHLHPSRAINSLSTPPAGKSLCPKGLPAYPQVIHKVRFWGNIEDADMPSFAV